MAVLVHSYACYPADADSKKLADRQIDLGCEYRDRLIRHEMICRNNVVERTKEEKSLATREDRSAFVARGLWYGTYWLAEEAAMMSSRKRRRDTEGKFSERGNGLDTGRLGAGIQASELVVCGPAGVVGKKITWTLTDKTKRVCVKLSCGKERDTMWSVRLHRPLPVGRVVRCIVTRVRTSSLARVGPPKYDYQMQFTIRLEEETQKTKTLGSRSVCKAAIDIGWWSESDTVRCYDLVDDAGHHERKLLPELLTQKHFHAHSIASIRDEGRQNLKLRTWVNRAYNDADAEAKRKQMAHLDVWAHNEEKRVVRMRDEWYRDVARDLCTRYSEIFVEDINLARIGRKKKGDQMRRYQPQNRVLAAPGTFRMILTNVAIKLGTTITLVEAAYTTQTCSICGDTTPWAEPGEREHRCVACGSVYERPWNSARNILVFGTSRKTPAEAAE